MSAELPVTVLVSRTAREPNGSALLRWAQQLCRDAARFPGHLASHVEPHDDVGGVGVRIGVTFASAEDLLRWERSPDRTHRLDEGDELTAGELVTLSVDDLGRWASARPSTTMTSRLRSASLIWIALFPPAVLLNSLLTPQLAAWPVAARTLLLTLVLVMIVVFVTLPLLQRTLVRLPHRLARRR